LPLLKFQPSYKVHSAGSALWSQMGDPAFQEMLLCVHTWTLRIFYSELPWLLSLEYSFRD